MRRFRREDAVDRDERLLDIAHGAPGFPAFAANGGVRGALVGDFLDDGAGVLRDMLGGFDVAAGMEEELNLAVREDRLLDGGAIEAAVIGVQQIAEVLKGKTEIDAATGGGGECAGDGIGDQKPQLVDIEGERFGSLRCRGVWRLA